MLKQNRSKNRQGATLPSNLSGDDLFAPVRPTYVPNESFSSLLTNPDKPPIGLSADSPVLRNMWGNFQKDAAKGSSPRIKTIGGVTTRFSTTIPATKNFSEIQLPEIEQVLRSSP